MNHILHKISTVTIALALSANIAGPVFAAPVPVNDAKTGGAKSSARPTAAPAGRTEVISFIARERSKTAPPSIIPPIVGFNDVAHALSSPAYFYAAEIGTLNQKYNEVPATVAATALGGLLARPFPRSGIPQVRAPRLRDMLAPSAFANDAEPSLTEVLKLDEEFDRILADLDAAVKESSGVELVKLHLVQNLVRLKRDMKESAEKYERDSAGFKNALLDYRARFRNALRYTINELFGAVVDEVGAGDASTKAILSLFNALLRTTIEDAVVSDLRKPPEQWMTLTAIVDAARRKLSGTLPDKTPTSKKMLDKLTEKGFYKLLALLDQLPPRFDDIVRDLGQIYDKLQALKKIVDEKQAELQRAGPIEAPALSGDVRRQFEAIIKRFLSDNALNANDALRQVRGIIKTIIADNVQKQVAGLYGFGLVSLAAKLNDSRITGKAYDALLLQLRDAAVAAADASVRSKETFWSRKDYERYIAAIVEFQISGEFLSRFLRLLERYSDPVKADLLSVLYNDAVKAVVSRYGNSPFEDIVGADVVATLRGLSDESENHLTYAKEKAFRAIEPALQGNAPASSGETAAQRTERERRNAEVKALKQLLLLVDIIVGNVSSTLKDLEGGEMKRIVAAQDAISKIVAAIEAQGDAILAKMKEQLGQSAANQDAKAANNKKRKAAVDAAAAKSGSRQCPADGGGFGNAVSEERFCTGTGLPYASLGSTGFGDCLFAKACGNRQSVDAQGRPTGAIHPEADYATIVRPSNRAGLYGPPVFFCGIFLWNQANENISCPDPNEIFTPAIVASICANPTDPSTWSPDAALMLNQTRDAYDRARNVYNRARPQNPIR